MIGSLGYVLEPKSSIFWKIQPIKLKVNPQKKLGSFGFQVFICICDLQLNEPTHFSWYVDASNWPVEKCSMNTWFLSKMIKWNCVLCQKVWLSLFKSEKRNREREQYRSILWKSAFQSASKILSGARVCFKILFLLTMGWRHLKAVENHFWFSEFEEIFTYHSEKATAGLKHLICLICQS